MYTLVSKLKARGSLLDKKPDSKEIALIEGILDVTDARLEMSPRKFFRLVQKAGFFKNICIMGHRIFKTVTI
jgi:hypothetical protein